MTETVCTVSKLTVHPSDNIEILLDTITTDIITAFCKWATLRLDKRVLLRYINHLTYCNLRTNTIIQYSHLQHKIQSHVCHTQTVVAYFTSSFDFDCGKQYHSCH